MRGIIVFVLLIVSLLLSACGAGSSRNNNTSELVSQKPREDAQLPISDLEKLAQANAEFAVELYKEVRRQPGNLVFSPFSISQAMAMTWGGARGSTESNTAAVMRFMLAQDKLHPAFNALDAYLRSLAKIDDQEVFKLNIANSIWGQKNFPFLDAYLDLLAVNYGAGLRLTDFAADPEAARLAINAWVADQTKDKIKNIVPQGMINPDTRLVLANAIYFKAFWQSQFSTDNTSDQPFTLLDGSQVSTATMFQQEGMAFRKDADFSAVELTYQGGQISMLLIMPAEGKFDAYEAALTPDKIKELAENMSYGEVKLSLPKFKFESSLDIKRILSAMGMQDAFDGGAADFSGMDGKKDLYISDILHKAMIAVDEYGSEAAAATVVVMGETAAMPQEPTVIQFDHPYIFAIRERQTGTILFMGRVVNPAE